MRKLSESETANLIQLRAHFDRFLEERMPVLTDFVQSLELPNPHMVLINADTFLPAISQYMQYQHIQEDDRSWILTRIGYFTGEWLVQRHGGCWLLNEIPDSRYFLRYVVGRFTKVTNRNPMVDPFSVAQVFVDSPLPRNLINLLTDVDSELAGS